jgi:tetratricopeptide (TPR) repeat protein
MKRYLPSKKVQSVIRALLIAVVILAGPIQSPPVWAQSAELYAAFKQYQALNKQGKYAEAVPFAQTFIELAKKEFGETHQNYASGLNNLTLLYNNQGRYADAEPLYKGSLAIDEKALGPDHPSMALGPLLEGRETRFPDGMTVARLVLLQQPVADQ